MIVTMNEAKRLRHVTSPGEAFLRKGQDDASRISGHLKKEISAWKTILTILLLAALTIGEGLAFSSDPPHLRRSSL
jgi:hypothetical protein